MGQMCEVCGKKPQVGHQISHSQRKAKRRWYPNLQRATILVDGRRKRVRLCVRCLKRAQVAAA